MSLAGGLLCSWLAAAKPAYGIREISDKSSLHLLYSAVSLLINLNQHITAVYLDLTNAHASSA